MGAAEHKRIAFVDVYLTAKHLCEAVDGAEAALKEAGYRADDVYMAWEVDLSQWEPDESDRPSKDTVEHLLLSGGFVFGDFLQEDEPQRPQLRLVR